MKKIAYVIKHKFTRRLVIFIICIIGFIEYQLYQHFKQLTNTYKNNFSTIATAAAEKVAANQHYCIVAPNYRDKHPWLLLNDFTELDIERVLKQAIYFHFGWPNRVKTTVGQRVPHFELYADGKHYLWSFKQQAFYLYRQQNSGFDRYMWLICQDLAGKPGDRRKASIAYQNDPQWIKKFLVLQISR